MNLILLSVLAKDLEKLDRQSSDSVKALVDQGQTSLTALDAKTKDELIAIKGESKEAKDFIDAQGAMHKEVLENEKDRLLEIFGADIDGEEVEAESRLSSGKYTIQLNANSSLLFILLIWSKLLH